jgi:hypothetical protein
MARPETRRPIMPGGTLDERVAALARDSERNNRRLADHEEMLGELAVACGDIAAQLASPARARPPSWFDEGGPSGAADVLADLISWLDRVYLRYPRAALPTCWLWHPWVVEELLWLRQAHHDAYDGEARSVAKRADWHERFRPGVVQRITADASGCELLCHQPGAEADQPPTVAPLASAADGIAAWTADGSQGTPPSPTTEQLAEADTTRRAHTHT